MKADEQFQIDVTEFDYEGLADRPFKVSDFSLTGRDKFAQYFTIIDNIITPELTLTPLDDVSEGSTVNVPFSITNVNPVVPATVTLEIVNPPADGRAYTLSGTVFMIGTAGRDDTAGKIVLASMREPGYRLPEQVTVAVTSIHFANQPAPIVVQGEPIRVFTIVDADRIEIESATLSPDLVMEGDGLTLTVQISQLIPAAVAADTVILDTVDPDQRTDFDLLPIPGLTDTINYEFPFDLTPLLMLTDTFSYQLDTRIDNLFEGNEQIMLQIIVNEGIIEIPQQFTQFTFTIVDSLSSDAVQLGLATPSVERVEFVEGQTVTLDVELTNPNVSYPQNVEIEYVIESALTTDDEYLATVADLGTAANRRITAPVHTGTVILPAGMAQTTIEISTVDDALVERYEQFTVRLLSARNLGNNEPVTIVGDNVPNFASQLDVYLEDNEPTEYRLKARLTFTEGERLTFVIQQVGTPRQEIEYRVVGYGDNPVLASDLTSSISNALLTTGAVRFSGVTRDATADIIGADDDIGELDKQLQIQVVTTAAGTQFKVLTTAIVTLLDNDPGVVFDVTDELVVDENGTVQIDVRLIGVTDLASYEGREVIISADNLERVGDRVLYAGANLPDVISEGLTATFGANGIATLELELVDNPLYENDAVFELIIESLQVDDSGTLVLSRAGEEPRRSVRVVSEDAPVIFLNPIESFSETDTVTPIMVKAPVVVGQLLTVALRAVNGTTEPEDYNLPTTVALVTGSIGAINLEIVNDDLYEGSEMLTVYVVSATLDGITTVFAEADQPRVQIEITSEDQPRVSFVPDRIYAPEGTRIGQQDLRLVLTNADSNGAPENIDLFAFVDESRTTVLDKIDYNINTSGQRTILAGQDSVGLDINISSDEIDDEPDQTLVILAELEIDGIIQRVAELTIIIQDVVPFELNFDETRLTEDGGTVNGVLDFSTSTIGASRSTETVTFVLDSAAERLGDYRVVTNDLVTSTVLINGATAFTVTVPAGSVMTTFTIEAVDDLIYEENEPLMLSLTDSSGGITFSGTAEIELTIVDNEVAVVTLPQPLIQLSEAMTAGVELPIEVNFATLDTLTVELLVTDNTAVRNRDYEPFATILEIARGATATMVTIVPDNNDDPTQASSRTFAVQLKSASYLSSTALVEVDSQAQTIVEIQEDDTFEIVTLTIPDLNLIGRPELGPSSTVEIQLELSKELTEEVRVGVALEHISTDGNDLELDDDELIFARGVTQTVTTLRILNHGDREFVESYRLVFKDLEPVPFGVIIDVVGMQTQTGTINPDPIDLDVSLTLPVRVSEADGERVDTIEIKWDNAPFGGSYEFGVRAVDVETTGGADYELIDTLDPTLRADFKVAIFELNDEAIYDVTLTILDDDINELAERLRIEIYEPRDETIVYASGTITILETFDPAELSFGATTAIVREGKTVDLPIAINNIGLAGLAEDVQLEVELSYNGIPEEKVVAQTSITVPQGTVTGIYSFSVARDGLLGESGTVTVQIRSASGVRTSEAHLIADPLTADRYGHQAAHGILRRNSRVG